MLAYCCSSKIESTIVVISVKRILVWLKVSVWYAILPWFLVVELSLHVILENWISKEESGLFIAACMIVYCFPSFICLIAIVWIYNLIWSVPLDFIKFGLQAVFCRNLKGIIPLDQLRRCLASRKMSTNTIAPAATTSTAVPLHRQLSRSVSTATSDNTENLELQPASILPELDHLARAGASFYSTYTEPLSALEHPKPLIKSQSIWTHSFSLWLPIFIKIACAPMDALFFHRINLHVFAWIR